MSSERPMFTPKKELKVQVGSPWGGVGGAA